MAKKQGLAWPPLLGGAASLGLGLAAYSLWEAQAFRLSVRPVPLGRRAGINLLQISDTHFTSRSRKLASFLKELPSLLPRQPELVCLTGDLIDDDTGIELCLESLTGIEAKWGRFFVLGSHDYYQGTPAGLLGIAQALMGGQRPSHTGAPAATNLLTGGLEASGWIQLTNRKLELEVPGGKLLVAGCDDPYLGRHRTAHLEHGDGYLLSLGLVHAPDIVFEFARRDFDLVLAGHTHGGQIALPGFGPLFTNSSVPRKLASGLNQVNGTWLHVSRGLGTARFAPLRLAARPEAVLLELD